MEDLKSPQKRYRPEIEGLRTITTLLIVIYHIWLGRVSGGIDVFFVLSGYLITMSLLSRIERAGTVHFGDFLMGLARRLFPQALLVIIVIGSLALLFFYLSWNGARSLHIWPRLPSILKTGVWRWMQLII